MRVVKGVMLLVKESVQQWRDDRVARLAAALAFYTLLSVPPLVAVVTALAGKILGVQAAEGELARRLEILVGPQTASVLSGLVKSAESGALTATLFGLAVLAFAGSNLFTQVKLALNTVWRAEDRMRGGVRGTLENRLLALLLVLFSGGLLVASVLASTVMSVVVGKIAQSAPATVHVPSGDELLTFLVFTVLIAVLFKALPDASISWRDVWIGAAFTALLLMVGTQVISLYLVNRGLGSVYGAAAVAVFVLLWIYYSVQVFLFGAVVTHVFAVRWGSRRHELDALLAEQRGDRAPEAGA